MDVDEWRVSCRKDSMWRAQVRFEIAPTSAFEGSLFPSGLGMIGDAF